MQLSFSLLTYKNQLTTFGEMGENRKLKTLCKQKKSLGMAFEKSIATGQEKFQSPDQQSINQRNEHNDTAYLNHREIDALVTTMKICEDAQTECTSDAYWQDVAKIYTIMLAKASSQLKQPKSNNKVDFWKVSNFFGN